MNKKILILLFCLLFLGIFYFGTLADQQEKISAYHGADSVFKAEGITVIWGVVRGDNEIDTMAYIKIITTAEAREHFKAYSVKATDAFSDSFEWLVKGKKLQAVNMVEQKRELFKDLTERTILFYESDEIENFETEEEDLSVYYQSLPDTSPEYKTMEELENYFIEAEKRLDKIETTVKTE